MFKYEENMNKLPILLLLLSAIQICHSMSLENFDSSISNQNYVQIPGAKVLQNRFNEMILDHFYSNASNIKELASKEIHILIVLGEVNKALRNYAKKVDPKTAEFVESLKYEILEILLADFPDQLKVLKEVMVKIKKDHQFYPRP